MITGVTGSGKDAAVSAVAEFGRRIAMEEYVYRGFQSYYALLDKLAESPAIACLTWDEAARNLASAKNVNSPDFQTITHLISLYGAGNKIIGATPGRRNDIPELEHPFIILLATAQPDMLMDALGGPAQTTGFVNRFLLFDSIGDIPPLNRSRSQVFSSKIGRAARTLRDHESGDEFTKIPFKDGKTFASFQEFEEIARRRTLKKDFTWARSNQNALILAGLAAVGMDPHRPVIDMDISRWARQIVTWSNDCWADRIRLVGGETRADQEWFKVERIIDRPADFLHLAAHQSQRKQLALMKQGYVPWSVLMRGTRLGKKKLVEVLSDMHEAQTVASIDKDDNPCYFSKHRIQE